MKERYIGERRAKKWKMKRSNVSHEGIEKERKGEGKMKKREREIRKKNIKDRLM